MQTETVTIHASAPHGELKDVRTVAAQTLTSDVTQTFVSAFELPTDVSWGLRSPRGRAFADDAPISSYAAADSIVRATLTLRAHLG